MTASAEARHGVPSSVTRDPHSPVVDLIVFPGGFNWPVWAAEDQGFFARHGVSVRVSTTPGSVFQWTALAKGDAQVAITLMDNVVAYREGQGAPGVVVDDAIAVMAMDVRGMPALVTARDVRSYADLRGRDLAVDALKTGNALVLIGMLEHGGLARDAYRLVQAGGVQQRFEGFKRGAYAASLFNAPFDGLLRESGFNVLDTAATLLPRFQGQVVATRRAWAEAHRPAVVALLRGLTEALDWLYDPSRVAEALSMYVRHTPGATIDDARVAHAVLFDPVTGFSPDGHLDVEGVARVIDLRARFGEPPRSLQEARAYCDLSFLLQAVDRTR